MGTGWSLSSHSPMRITSAEARRGGYDSATIARIEADEVAWREAEELIRVIDQVFVAILPAGLHDALPPRVSQRW